MADHPILYSFRRCPYAMRARMALLVSETKAELREVALRDKPALLLQASAKATVPVLVLPSGEVIDESIDIMRWALAQHDPEHWLEGHDAAIIARNDGAFKYHLDRYKYPDRYDDAPDDHRAACLDILCDIERLLTHKTNICAATHGLTDIAIMPFVRQYAATDQQWFDAQILPQVQAWLARHTHSALFAATMQKIAPWRAGDEPTWLGDCRS